MKNLWLRVTATILLLLTTFSVFATPVANYYFPILAEQKRFQQLLSELRCVVCQNQSLAESHAPLAIDLKNEVYGLVQRGYSDDEIKKYLVARYGEYILFKPNLNNISFVLWLGPIIFLLGASAIMFTSIRRQTRAQSQRVV